MLYLCVYRRDIQQIFLLNHIFIISSETFSIVNPFITVLVHPELSSNGVVKFPRDLDHLSFLKQHSPTYLVDTSCAANSRFHHLKALTHGGYTLGDNISALISNPSSISIT